MRRVSDVPPKPLKLGEVLIKAGVIDDSQLEAALAHQRNWGGRLGACLVKLGFVTEEKLLAAVAEQLKLPRLDLAGRAIPEEVLAYLPAEKARQYNVIPVARQEMHGTLYLLIAMTDPTNLIVIDDLQFITGCRVRPGLASEVSVQKAIDRCYGPLPEQPQSAAVADAPPSADRVEPLPAGPVDVTDRAETPEEKLQCLFKILLDKGILSLREYERLK